MGFFPENITPEKNDYKLFEQMWEMIDGPERHAVATADLEYILMLVRGARFPEREVD